MANPNITPIPKHVIVKLMPEQVRDLTDALNQLVREFDYDEGHFVVGFAADLTAVVAADEGRPDGWEANPDTADAA